MLVTLQNAQKQLFLHHFSLSFLENKKHPWVKEVKIYMNNQKYLTPGQVTFQIFNYIGFIIFTLLCFYPFYYVFINSISDGSQIAKGAVLFFPKGISFDNYINIFKLEGIANAFFISASRAVIGTVLTLFCSSMLGYTLTKRILFGRKVIYRMVIFAMYVSAGLIPWFLTMKTYGLSDNFMLYILPTIIAPFSLILIKTYIEQISPEIEESAVIDGAGYFRIFIQIILPLSKPVLAACAVFNAVNQWNAWQDNFFLVSSKELQTLQLILLNYLKDAENIVTMMQQSTGMAQLAQQKNMLTPFTVKTTITMIVTIPILFVYPFLQKYFVKGIMVGAVKG